MVVINAKYKWNAFVIFKTINTRETNLTVADIIKPHLLSSSLEDNTFAKIQTKISKELKNTSSYITSFVTIYVWVKYGTPTECELFEYDEPAIKK